MTAQQSLDFARARLGYYAPNDPQPGSEAGRWLARKLGPGKTVVTVLPDTAERYYSTQLFGE